ncbi:CLUMA_CG001096, isoform A [Clunio marinus]|uniref:CLUMA_CG001096, isoform A n=1 Tax=Clunio marinus TaxID=568069 RepID=A0A1J1HLG8_9DIPT|nr:CLUMA_CG001096, isoform A [Clunio marinus]
MLGQAFHGFKAHYPNVNHTISSTTAFTNRPLMLSNEAKFAMNFLFCFTLLILPKIYPKISLKNSVITQMIDSIEKPSCQQQIS